MQPYILSCCSTADLSKDYFEQREIHYVCFHFTIDGEEYADDLGQSMPFEEFYGKIAAGAMPTTSLVNTAQFIEFFEPFLKEGKDILHLSFSSGLSGTYAAALLAQEELKERYPDRTLVIVDSLGASSGYGLMVDTLADMRDNGVSLQDAAAWIEEHKLNLHHWFFSTDLTHYKRGGRISCHEDAETVAALVESTFPKLNGKVLINSVGTVVGSHTGPGTVALFFWGDSRKKD